MIVAVRVRGPVDANSKVEKTLQTLNLDRKNQCVVLEKNDSVMGMLNHVKDYIAFGEADKDTIEKLEDRNGEELESGDTVNLSPPTGGFNSTKKQYGQGGTLGEREDISELIGKMA